jgi:hypothetical protein
MHYIFAGVLTWLDMSIRGAAAGLISSPGSLRSLFSGLPI